MRQTGFIAIFFWVIIVLNNAGCSLEGEDTAFDGELSHAVETIDGIFEGDFAIPLPKDYALLYVELTEPLEILLAGNHSLKVTYGLEKGGLWEPFQDKKIVEEFEESRGVRVLYGPYEGVEIAAIEYAPHFVNMSFSGEDGRGRWRIKDKEIEYITLSRGRDMIMFHLELENGGMQVTCYLNEEFNEKNAENFARYLVGQFN